MKKLIFIILIALSCRQEDVKKVELTSDYLIFGRFYGECIGEQCIEIYELTDKVLYEDKADKYPNSNEAYHGDFQLLDDSLFQKVKTLRTQIPPGLEATSSGTIGQPDAGDWGGIYVETSIDGEKRFWLIDKMRANLPAYLIPFVDEVENNIDLLSN